LLCKAAVGFCGKAVRRDVLPLVPLASCRPLSTSRDREGAGPPMRAFPRPPHLAFVALAGPLFKNASLAGERCPQRACPYSRLIKSKPPQGYQPVRKVFHNGPGFVLGCGGLRVGRRTARTGDRWGGETGGTAGTARTRWDRREVGPLGRKTGRL
jgi:hypothetical protein